MFYDFIFFCLTHILTLGTNTSDLIPETPYGKSLKQHTQASRNLILMSVYLVLYEYLG